MYLEQSSKIHTFHYLKKRKFLETLKSWYDLCISHKFRSFGKAAQYLTQLKHSYVPTYF